MIGKFQMLMRLMVLEPGAFRKEVVLFRFIRFAWKDLLEE